MAVPHLFEFMDQDWLPQGMRHTLREVLECGNSRPFRGYYEWVARETLAAARAGGYDTIVELAAGTAPITRLMAESPDSQGFKLVVSDLNPHTAAFRELARQYPGKVEPILTPVDISVPHDWKPKTLVIISGAFHHLPPALRPKVLAALTASAGRVMIFEPLRKTPTSVLYVLGSLVPALLIPALYARRPGRFRRLLCCWLFPWVPLIFLWEGVVSCARMWSDEEWRAQLARCCPPGRPGEVRSTTFCQMVAW